MRKRRKVLENLNSVLFVLIEISSPGLCRSLGLTSPLLTRSVSMVVLVLAEISDSGDSRTRRGLSHLNTALSCHYSVCSTSVSIGVFFQEILKYFSQKKGLFFLIIGSAEIAILQFYHKIPFTHQTLPAVGRIHTAMTVSLPCQQERKSLLYYEEKQIFSIFLYLLTKCRR